MDWSLSLKGKVLAPGGRSGQISRFLRFLEGLVMYITRRASLTTAMDHIFTLSYIQARSLALGPRFGLVLGLERRLLWLPGVVLADVDF